MMECLKGFVRWLMCGYTRGVPPESRERFVAKRLAVMKLADMEEQSATCGNVRAAAQRLVKAEGEQRVESLAGLARVFRGGPKSIAGELLAHAWVQADRLDEIEVAYEDERGDGRFEDWCAASLGVDRDVIRFYRTVSKMFPTAESLPDVLTLDEARKLIAMFETGEGTSVVLAVLSRRGEPQESPPG